MAQWWDSLSTLLKVLYGIATFSSTILVLQTLRIFFGFGGDDSLELDGSADVDMDADLDSDFSDHGDGSHASDFDVLRLFSFQSIVAFLTVFCWMSILFIHSGTPEALSLGVGVVFGLAAMLGVAKMIQLSAKLVSIGNVELKNALGQTGRVYIPIGANGKSAGKVIVSLRERQVEQDAVTEGGADLASGEQVRVVDIRGNILVVEREE